MMLMVFRTAGVSPAHHHEAGRRPAVRKTMTRHWSGAPPALTRQHRLADDLRAVHQAAQALVEGVAAVHDAAIVP